MIKGDEGMNNDSIMSFKLPRYNELPEIDLYIEQVISYIDGIFAPLGIDEKGRALTPYMVNNYVKQGVVPPTVKKKYSKKHIAYLSIVYIAKQIFSIEEIGKMIKVQTKTFDIETAYNYMCNEAEFIIRSVFMNKPIPQDTTKTNSQQRFFVRDPIIAFAHKLYTQKLLAAYCDEDLKSE